MKVLVIGSLNIDLVADLDRFPNEGETLLGNTLTQLIGGKGANQASAVASQDVFTTLWGMAGSDDFGAYIIQKCQQIGIHTNITQVNQNTGTALIERDKTGKNRIVVIPGANAEFTIHQAQQNLSLLDEHDIIVMQFEIPLDTITFLAQESKKRNKIVIVNPAPALSMNEELLQNIDYIIPNEHELSIITGLPTSTQDEIQVAVSALKKKVPNVLTTLGEKGVYVSSNDLEKIVEGHRITPIDTTGAGDSFVGAFAALLALGATVEEAVKYANKSAAISVTKIGAFNAAGSKSEVQDFH